MWSSVTVTEPDERSPLLQNSREITPFASPLPENQDVRSSATHRKQRLVSLDVFRGLTVAVMILVDDAGGAFPSINHSPWFGVTLADFVMPFFLFGVGISVSLVFKKVTSKPAATKKVVLRTIKLFLLGLILQAIALVRNPVFHGRSKHIDIHYHFIRECVENGHINVEYVRGELQRADILTKALPRLKFVTMRQMLGVQDLGRSNDQD